MSRSQWDAPLHESPLDSPVDQSPVRVTSSVEPVEELIMDGQKKKETRRHRRSLRKEEEQGVVAGCEILKTDRHPSKVTRSLKSLGHTSGKVPHKLSVKERELPSYGHDAEPSSFCAYECEQERDANFEVGFQSIQSEARSTKREEKSHSLFKVPSDDFDIQFVMRHLRAIADSEKMFLDVLQYLFSHVWLGALF